MVEYNGRYLGEWPKVEKMELMSENRTGMWYDIGEFKALIIPIPTGKQSSRLWRNPQLRASLEMHLQLPIAGVDKNGDHILVYPKGNQGRYQRSHSLDYTILSLLVIGAPLRMNMAGMTD